MQRYNVTLTGISPLLMHNHSVDWLDSMKRWLADPMNKKKSVAGDDRTPAFTWIGGVYHDAKYVGMASDNLMKCFGNGGSAVTLSGKKTFKSAAAAGVLVNEILWPVEVSDGRLILWEDIARLVDEEDFEVHKKTAADLGFELFVKPCVIGKNKHIRVRARFDQWRISGSITIVDEMINEKILEQILYMAGNYCGLGDWRPNVKAPGPFGKFTAEIKKAK
jgi:hypothetical protein